MIVIGTRGSELALWQARHIQGRLGGETSGVTLEIVKTTGDRMLDIPLQQQLDKGFFTKELEHALLERRVGVAVHSLKDLPTQMPDGLTLAAVPPRADVGDLLLVRKDALDPSQHRSAVSGWGLPLKAGAKVGTASMRRMALLKHVAPQVEAAFLRGNVPTRLKKAITGELDAVILARAGVARLGLDPQDLVVFDLDPTRWLPAAAQGALGIQCRGDDATILARLQTLHDDATAGAVALERGLLRRTEGGCHSAFGALAEVGTNGAARLRAGLADEQGRWQAVEVVGNPDDLVEAAYAALMDAVQGRPHPARAQNEDTPWYTPARPWS